MSAELIQANPRLLISKHVDGALGIAEQQYPDVNRDNTDLLSDITVAWAQPNTMWESLQELKVLGKKAASGDPNVMRHTTREVFSNRGPLVFVVYTSTLCYMDQLSTMDKLSEELAISDPSSKKLYDLLSTPPSLLKKRTSWKVHPHMSVATATIDSDSDGASTLDIEAEVSFGYGKGTVFTKVHPGTEHSAVRERYLPIDYHPPIVELGQLLYLAGS